MIPEDADGREAKNHMHRAQAEMQKAAEALGYDGVRELAEAYDDGVFSGKEKYAIKAITDAHSCLNGTAMSNLENIDN